MWAIAGPATNLVVWSFLVEYAVRKSVSLKCIHCAQSCSACEHFWKAHLFWDGLSKRRMEAVTQVSAAPTAWIVERQPAVHVRSHGGLSFTSSAAADVTPCIFYIFSFASVEFYPLVLSSTLLKFLTSCYDLNVFLIDFSTFCFRSNNWYQTEERVLSVSHFSFSPSLRVFFTPHSWCSVLLRFLWLVQSFNKSYFNVVHYFDSCIFAHVDSISLNSQDVLILVIFLPWLITNSERFAS